MIDRTVDWTVYFIQLMLGRIRDWLEQTARAYAA